MKAIVVYESHWGNTTAVANAIAEGIGSGTRVMSTSQADTTALQSADLLVVGAPVIGFRLSTPEALEGMRTKGGKKNPPDISHPPVRTWLESLPQAGAAATAAATTGPAAAAFDTRIRGPFGSAAPAILEGLEKAGYRAIAKPVGFLVKGSQGPMRDGEARARSRMGRGVGTRDSKRPSRERRVARSREGRSFEAWSARGRRTVWTAGTPTVAPVTAPEVVGQAPPSRTSSSNSRSGGSLVPTNAVAPASSDSSAPRGGRSWRPRRSPDSGS